jgi:hypothetical protein
MQLRFLLAAAVFLGLAGPVPAQQVDPADVTFWQSIQSSQNPAEYAAYLTSFPKGVFAELARLRIAQLGGQAPAKADAAAPAVAQPAVPAPTTPALGAAAPDDQPLSDAELSIEPAAPRVGQSIKVRFADMPTPSSYDTVIVVAAGSPASTGTTSDENVLKKTYIANQYYLDNGWEVGSLPPGRYEIRWMTSLYNTANRLEVGAKFAFQVAR